ncbi:MAG: AmmeMemoRadiSam system protein B [Candidatus Absconditabacterales bacterium]
MKRNNHKKKHKTNHFIFTILKGIAGKITIKKVCPSEASKKIQTITFLTFFLILFALVKVVFPITNIFPHPKYFAIIPHFDIKPNTIDNFYSYLKKNISKIGPVNIVLISPNHFNLGKGNIQTTCENNNLCFKGNCVKIKSLIGKIFTECNKNKNTYSDFNNLFANQGDVLTTQEHGLGNHFKFINKYFPKAKIYPIVLDGSKFSNIDKLIKFLNNYNFGGTTLFIGSVDFSHYVQDDFASLHDKKTFYTLNNSLNINDYKKIEVDCQSCLYLINKLAKKNNQNPNLIDRDSSSEIIGKELGTGNTSRQFIFYDKFKTKENGITIAFFGDLIFDRGVKFFLNTDNKIKKYFQNFYQQNDVQLSSKNNIHKKLFGIDFVGLNLETPVVSDLKICKPLSGLINFCSSDKILPYLNTIGFNLANLTNNHSLNGGKDAFVETKKQLQANQINYFGYIKGKGTTEENNIFTGKIRNLKYARHGYNFIGNNIGLETYCKILKKYKSDGYINFVSVHRGIEYQNKHNAIQENLGKNLIDCGADVIIGHHPHVIQDIEIYKGKPIIYSLGNFLFDQNFSKETKIGGYILIDYQSDGRINIWTGTVNSSVYR